MADMGKASKSVMLDLINNIKQFTEIVSKEITDIQKNAIDLADCWNDPQYQEFLAYTTDITKKLKNDISLLENVEVNLTEKVKKFD